MISNDSDESWYFRCSKLNFDHVPLIESDVLGDEALGGHQPTALCTESDATTSRVSDQSDPQMGVGILRSDVLHVATSVD